MKLSISNLDEMVITKIGQHIDKIYHFQFNFGLVIVFSLIGIIFDNLLLGIIIGIFTAVILSSIKELYDRIVKGQSLEASRLDLIADTIGIVVAIVIIILITIFK